MKLSFKCKKGVVNIDGREFTGHTIVINGNKVHVDGAPQDGELIGDVKVLVNGDIESLDLGAGSVDAVNIGSINSDAGNIKCNDVSGNIKTRSGDVVCKNINGNVTTTTGSVDCHTVSGNVETCTGHVIKRY